MRKEVVLAALWTGFTAFMFFHGFPLVYGGYLAVRQAEPDKALAEIRRLTYDLKPTAVTVVDKTQNYQRVMLYDPELSFVANLKNLMPLQEAQTKVASCRRLGCKIISPERNGSYMLPDVFVEQYEDDGTPVAEGEFHRREEASASALAKK